MTWFWVMGDGVNAKIPANDPDEAMDMVGKITGTSMADLAVYSQNGHRKFVECWTLLHLMVCPMCEKEIPSGNNEICNSCIEECNADWEEWGNSLCPDCRRHGCERFCNDF